METLACMQARFLAVAGFGNLPGDMAFYERKDEKGGFQQLGSARCAAGRCWLLTLVAEPSLQEGQCYSFMPPQHMHIYQDSATEADHPSPICACVVIATAPRCLTSSRHPRPVGMELGVPETGGWLCRAEYGVLAEWSPSGRILLVATTAPRLRVDNGFTLYSYNGSMLSRQPFEVSPPTPPRAPFLECPSVQPQPCLKTKPVKGVNP